MGIAPKVISDIHTKEYSISEFINGQLITGEEVKQTENIIQFANILKKIHSISGVDDRACSAFDLIDGYVRGSDMN